MPARAIFPVLFALLALRRRDRSRWWAAAGRRRRRRRRLPGERQRQLAATRWPRCRSPGVRRGSGQAPRLGACSPASSQAARSPWSCSRASTTRRVDAAPSRRSRRRAARSPSWLMSTATWSTPARRPTSTASRHGLDRGRHRPRPTWPHDEHVPQAGALLARAYAGRRLDDSSIDDEAAKIDSELQGAKLVTLDDEPLRRGDRRRRARPGRPRRPTATDRADGDLARPGHAARRRQRRHRGRVRRRRRRRPAADRRPRGGQEP